MLAVSRDGSLWAGYGGRGGVSRLKDGGVRTYDSADGLAEGAVTSLVEDPSGDMCAIAGGDLFRFSGDRWQPWNSNGTGPAAGLDAGRLHRQQRRTAHRRQAGIFRRRAMRHEFDELEASDSLVQAVAEDSAGRIWATDRFVGFRKLGERPPKGRAVRERQRHSPVHRSTRATCGSPRSDKGCGASSQTDRPRDTIVEQATALTGLSNNVTYSLLEDREGNIWVGTTDGLNRLTPHKVTQMVDLGLVTGLATGPNGDVWAATPMACRGSSSRGPNGNRPQSYFRGFGARAMSGDKKGTFGLRQTPASGNFRAADVAGAGDDVTAARRGHDPDEHGSLWINDLDRGIGEGNDGKVEPFNLPAEFQGDAHRPDVHDRVGRVWLGLPLVRSSRSVPTRRSASTVLRMD